MLLYWMAAASAFIVAINRIEPKVWAKEDRMSRFPLYKFGEKGNDCRIQKYQVKFHVEAKGIS